jgi:hypothetical protein
LLTLLSEVDSLVLGHYIVGTELQFEISVGLLCRDDLFAVGRVLTRVHGLFLLEFLDLLLPHLPLQLPLLALLLALGLVLLDRCLLSRGLAFGHCASSCLARIFSTCLRLLILFVGGVIAAVGILISFVDVVHATVTLLAHEHLTLKHLFEGLNRLLKEIRHLVNSKGGHI